MATDETKNKNIEAPDDFDIAAGREMADGWIIKAAGNVVQGRLLGRHTMPAKGNKKPRSYYQIRLQKPAKATSGKGEDVEEVELKPGQIANVDESKALEELQTYLGKGTDYDVWFAYKAKEELSDGNTFWPVSGPNLRKVAKEIPF